MPMDGFSFSSRLASGNCLRRFHKCHLLPASGQVRAPRVPKRASYARFETTRGKETRVSARHAFPSATTTTVRDGRATLLLNFNVGSYGASRARGSSILFHRKTTAVPVDRGRVTRISPRSNLPPPSLSSLFLFFFARQLVSVHRSLRVLRLLFRPSVRSSPRDRPDESQRAESFDFALRASESHRFSLRHVSKP